MDGAVWGVSPGVPFEADNHGGAAGSGPSLGGDQQPPARKAHRPDDEAAPWAENQPWSDGIRYSRRCSG